MEAPPAPRLGKYELRGELGRGAMGVVYRAFDEVLHREVALKTMAAPLSDEAQTVRFLREARTAGSLHHPNIVTIHELGHDSGTYFISMELLKGQNLQEMIKLEQLPPIRRRLEIVARLCDGLDYAHRAGIVHRDIKPANVFLLANGSVKILDFGIAKIAASDATRTGLLIGTVDYMSPEQVRAAKDLDGRSDIFSAGVILYELLFRRRPFGADDLGAALHRILHQQPPGYSLFSQILPAELADVLTRSLDKRREARFATAGEISAALDPIAEDLRGRAGTELEERIDEVIVSGVLDRKEEEVSVGPDGETQPCTEVATRPLSEAPKAKRRLPNLAILAGAAVLFILAAIFGGRLIFRDRPDDTALSPRAELRSPAVTQPESSSAPVPVAPVVEEEAAPAEASTPILEPEQPEPEPAPPPVAPAPRGALNVLAMPWANIAWIENLETGERVPSDKSTPVRLELPAGRYRLRLVNPYVARPVDLDVEVRGNRTDVIRHTMPGFDAAELTREILAGEGSRGRP